MAWDYKIKIMIYILLLCYYRRKSSNRHSKVQNSNYGERGRER